MTLVQKCMMQILSDKNKMMDLLSHMDRHSLHMRYILTHIIEQEDIIDLHGDYARQNENIEICNGCELYFVNRHGFWDESDEEGAGYCDECGFFCKDCINTRCKYFYFECKQCDTHEEYMLCDSEMCMSKHPYRDMMICSQTCYDANTHAI